ncbi:DUF4928 family protein [bacterium]|nr:DUF4928 family protein [bacterium]
MSETACEHHEEYRGQKRLAFSYDSSVSTRTHMTAIVEASHGGNRAGAVTQHLVGAKLQMRFPEAEIPNRSYSTADQQTGSHGDFQIGDTAFHVSVAPMGGHYARCKENQVEGLRSYLLVPESCLVGTRQNVVLQSLHRTTVESIESFVAQNLDEIASFSEGGIRKGIASLLKEYNRRVAEVETDKSLLIQIPANLKDAIDG